MTYHIPPDDYSPPTTCERCGRHIYFGPVIGGSIWSHVGRADHDVVMRPEGWWDTETGQMGHGNGRDLLVVDHPVQIHGLGLA